MDGAAGPFSRLMHALARIQPHELKAVALSFAYFFLIMASYYILRPIRDAMGTVYGADRLEELWTVTFFATFLAAPAYAFFASKLKLQTFLPWVYGFFVANILVFYVLFEADPESRPLAAIFYVWLSVFNMFIISVFWTFMADLYARSQSKRLFGFIAAGGSVGAAVGPAITAILVTMVGTDTMLLISAAGFGLAIMTIVLLVREKARMLAVAGPGEETQQTRLDHKLGGNPFAGFTLLFKSPFLLLIAVFILLLTWVSTILYIQQAQFISDAFASREERTQVFAIVDLIVNVGAIGVQVFGTGRLIERFGVTTGLVLVPIVMFSAFLLIAASPVLLVLLGVQVVRRVAEYAVSRPSREMLFTVIDQESKYKAKNAIDTVVYRFGDLSAAWGQAGLQAWGLGAAAIAVVGAAVAAIWGVFALILGRRFEGIRGNIPARGKP